MTIYKRGEAQEEIHLHKYKTKEDIHRLFQEKGFVKRSSNDNNRPANATDQRMTQEQVEKNLRKTGGSERMKGEGNQGGKEESSSRRQRDLIAKRREDELLRMASKTENWRGFFVIGGLATVGISLALIVTRRRKSRRVKR